ncbi:hypothetical protein [Prescottella equi]
MGEALFELARRVRYHGDDIARALRDLNKEDQDRLKVAAETILAS